MDNPPSVECDILLYIYLVVCFDNILYNVMYINKQTGHCMIIVNCVTVIAGDW